MICGALQTLNEEAFEDVVGSERPSPTGGPSGEPYAQDNMPSQPPIVLQSQQQLKSQQQQQYYHQQQQQPLTPIKETNEQERLQNHGTGRRISLNLNNINNNNSNNVNNSRNNSSFVGLSLQERQTNAYLHPQTNTNSSFSRSTPSLIISSSENISNNNNNNSNNDAFEGSSSSTVIIIPSPYDCKQSFDDTRL